MGFFRNIFGGGRSASDTDQEQGSDARIPRRSTGFHEFTRTIARPEGQFILDLGPTSPKNLEYITGLGHRAYNEDVLAASKDPALVIPGEEPGSTTFDVDRFSRETLKYEREMFDAVLLWDVCDYLPEPLVKPLVERLHYVMKPKGLLLAFFHTKDAGSQAPFFRYHIVSPDTLELQRGHQYKLQRVFANRHVENLFQDYTSFKFFLGKENVREVLIVR